VPWSEAERIASGRAPVLGDGSDSPAWSRKRESYAGAPEDLRERRGRDDGGERLRAPYAELHVHSNFSFLDAPATPKPLVEEAAWLELDALVLTDHDGMYGVGRFNDAARQLGVRVGFGAEL
jgi:error-prone DNA polymerase